MQNEISNEELQERIGLLERVIELEEEFAKLWGSDATPPNEELSERIGLLERVAELEEEHLAA